MTPFQDETVETQVQMEEMADKAGQDVTAALQGLKNGDFNGVMQLLQGYLIPAVEVLLLRASEGRRESTE